MLQLKDFGKVAISSSKRWRVPPRLKLRPCCCCSATAGGDRRGGQHPLNLGYVSSDQLKAIAAYCRLTSLSCPLVPTICRWACWRAWPVVRPRCPSGWGEYQVGASITGYLAEPGDATDLSNGILQLLEDEVLRQALSQRCRMIALKDYPLELQVQRYTGVVSPHSGQYCHDVPGSAACGEVTCASWRWPL